jgi:hypothetical protein
MWPTIIRNGHSLDRRPQYAKTIPADIKPSRQTSLYKHVRKKSGTSLCIILEKEQKKEENVISDTVRVESNQTPSEHKEGNHFENNHDSARTTQTNGDESGVNFSDLLTQARQNTRCRG